MVHLFIFDLFWPTPRICEIKKAIAIYHEPSYFVCVVERYVAVEC